MACPPTRRPGQHMHPGLQVRQGEEPRWPPHDEDDLRPSNDVMNRVLTGLRNL